MSTKLVNETVNAIISRARLTPEDVSTLDAAVGRNVDAEEQRVLATLSAKIARGEVVVEAGADPKLPSHTRWQSFKEGLTPSAMLLGAGPMVALGMGNGRATPQSVVLGVLVSVLAAPIAVAYAPIGALVGAVHALRD